MEFCSSKVFSGAIRKVKMKCHLSCKIFLQKKVYCVTFFVHNGCLLSWHGQNIFCLFFSQKSKKATGALIPLPDKHSKALAVEEKNRQQKRDGRNTVS